MRAKARECEKAEREKNKKCNPTAADKAVDPNVRAGAVNWSLPWECVPEFCSLFSDEITTCRQVEYNRNLEGVIKKLRPEG